MGEKRVFVQKIVGDPQSVELVLGLGRDGMELFRLTDT